MGSHRVDAEVAGGLGPGIDYDPRRTPTLVGDLHYEFSGWMGDDLVTTSSYWLVTGRLATALHASPLTGYELADVVVTTDDAFEAFPPRYDFPDDWRRLIPTGTPGTDDIALEGRTQLVVSDAALALLRQHRLDDAIVTSADEPAPVSDVMRRYLESRTTPDDAARLDSGAES